MAEIVRDIVKTQQAQTVTPDYQAPNGFGAILGGVADSFGNLISGFGKGGKGGSGSDKDIAGAYDYVRQNVNLLDSTPTSSSEKQKRYDDVAVNAMRIFKVDENDIKNIYEMTGMQKYGDVPKALRNLNLDMETLQQKNTLLVGSYIAPNASIDTKMQLGATTMAQLSQVEVSVQGLRSMTPEQQQGVLEKGPIKTSLTNAIALMWADQYSRPEMQNIPEEAALMSFKDNMVNYLASQKVEPNIARAFVDNATLAQQVQIYGTEYLENKKGLEFLRDKAKKSYDVTNQIQEADMLNQFFDMTFTDVPLNAIGVKGSGTLTGRELYFLVGSNGSEASVSGLLKALDPAAVMKILPQLVSQTKDRWTWQQMKLVLSEQGATMASILSDNEEASKNVADGVLKANEEMIKDFNAQSPEKKKATNSYWLPAEQLIKAFTLPTGALQDPKVVDVGYDQKMKDDIKESFFRSVTAGTDSATVDPGLFGTSAGGFYQIADDGSVHYYGLAGNRWENIVTPLNVAVAAMTDVGKRAAVELKDLTNAGKYVRGGDMDAVRMREGIPVVQRGLEMLEKSFGFDRRELIKEFNDYQIRNSIGGQKARSNQILLSSGEYGAYRDLSQTREMSDRDVKMVQEQIKGGLPDAGKGAQSAVETFVEQPLEMVEAASDFATTGTLALFGDDRVGWDVTAKQDGKDVKMRVTVDTDGFNVLREDKPEVRHVPSKDLTEAGAKEMLLSVYDIANPVMKALNVQTAAPKAQGATVTKTSTGYSLVLPDGTRQGNYKTPAEAFRASVKPVSSSRELPANVSRFEYAGNYDLGDRQVVKNSDGTISTEYSIVIEEDGEYIVIPTVVDGKIVSEEDAVEFYHRTGLNHGKYKTEKEAVKASKEISKIQAQRYLKD